MLSDRARAQLHGDGIEVWDGQWILAAAERAGLYDEVSRFVSEDIWMLVSGRGPAPAHGPRQFATTLASTPAGKANWSQYQSLCKDIFEYLFCPPLETPLWESANWSGVNRRDLILPNYADDGIWRFLRETYRADLVVIDAKNYNQRIKKAPIPQIAHYLSHHGTGLLGMIVSRAGLDPAAQPIVREQWVLHNKMIINLSDDDILQMLTMRAAGEDPAVLIRQKIEDFRVTM